MGKTPLPTTHVLMHRELVLYKTPRSEVWQCRYKVDHRWLRSTTKEYDLDKARTKAKELMIEAEIRRRSNLPVVTRRFRDIAKLAIERMQQVDFPRFSRQLIMSEITKRKLNERHQIYRRV